jgi:hypothetical protein
VKRAAGLFVCVLAVLMVPARAARAQATPAVTPPRVSATVDRTAIWIGDRLQYEVEIRCAPGVDILTDDLDRAKLRLNGLEVVTSDTSVVTDAAGATTHRARYVLTTYRVDTPAPSIEATSVRYYARRPGERPQDVAPAGEVQVPGAALALRSTLPENQPDLVIRDGRDAAPRRGFFSRASQIGLGLIVVSLAPALVVATAAVRRRAAGKPARRSARMARQDQRATLERLRALDVTTEAERRRACEEISAAVRGYVASHTQVPAEALTAPEIDAALAARGGRLPRETVVALLTACDEARYGPAQAVLSADACRDAIASAEQVLSGR